jgi:hypothetical protein
MMDGRVVPVATPGVGLEWDDAAVRHYLVA